MKRELEKTIIGKWVEIKEIARDIYSIMEYFRFPAELLERETEALTGAVEMGILEFKRNKANLLYRALGDAQYKSLPVERIEEIRSWARVLCFITLLQRLISADIVKLEEPEPGMEISARNIEINMILKDILARIKENPDFTKKTATKNILVQFSIYKNERETLKKLSPNIKNKSDTFYNNFKATFEKIFASIRRNYEEILKEDLQQFTRQHILRNVQDKKLSALLLSQLKEHCRLLASLDFVLAEKYKTRGILIMLADSGERLLGLFGQEEDYYRSYSSTTEAPEKMLAAICNGFNKEIVKLINKQLNA